MADNDDSEVRLLRRERAELVRDRDEALEQVDKLVVQLDEARRSVDELELTQGELKAEVALLEKERDEATSAAEEVRDLASAEQHGMIAQIVEQHEREIGRVAVERDSAKGDAERAAAEAERAFARADKATQELVVERRRIDQMLRESHQEVERLVDERDLALNRVEDLTAMHAAAEEDILRVGEQLLALEEQKKRHESKLTDLQDKFIEELLQGHEKELSTLAKQRDDARSRLDSLADQVTVATKEAESAASVLDAQREAAARLAKEREAAALELDAVARERETSMRDAAQRIAEQDKFIADLVDSHGRELGSMLRQRDFAARQAEDAERATAELRTALERVTEERDRLLARLHGITGQHNQAIVRLFGESEQKAKGAAAEIARLKALLARQQPPPQQQPPQPAEASADDVRALKATIGRLVEERDRLREDSERDIVDLKGTISRLIQTIPPPAMNAVDAAHDIADLKRTITHLIEERDRIGEEAKRDIAELKATIIRLLDSE